MDSGAVAMIPVFINERLVTVEAGGTAADAVTAADPDWGRALREGRAYLTDGRGIRLESDVMVGAGTILRVIVSARQASPDANADA